MKARVFPQKLAIGIPQVVVLLICAAPATPTTAAAVGDVDSDAVATARSDAEVIPHASRRTTEDGLESPTGPESSGHWPVAVTQTGGLVAIIAALLAWIAYEFWTAPLLDGSGRWKQ